MANGYYLLQVHQKLLSFEHDILPEAFTVAWVT